MTRLTPLVCAVALGWAGCNGGEPSPRSPSSAKPALDQPVVNQPVVGSASSADGLASVLIPDVPHLRQKPDFCGEAVAAAYLRALGQDYDQDQVFELSSMEPARGMGATTRELKVALERIGFTVGKVWYQAAVANANEEMAAHFAKLHADLLAGVPSIICTRYDGRPNTTEHFRLILGYAAATDEVIYHEPAEANGGYRRMKRSEFISLWPLKYAADQWTVIRFRLAAAKLRPPPAKRGFSKADFAQHVMKLRARIPDHFTIVVEPPFVVIGDSGPAKVAKQAESTVRWAVERLKQDYFSKDPGDILDIWLFKGDKSYRKYAKQLFGDEPDTPYGYYSSTDKALVMNISTGGGTLVHEIVHPFVEANFPDCPAWFNEGLGSLYEQSGTRAGHIIGYTNWRLAGLQDAIRARAVPSFATLTSTTTGQFYNHDPGSNYAQARYLLYYLQEQGLLIDYYRQFHAARTTDPTGYQTLKKVLALDDAGMARFEKQWRKYVLGLRFP